MTRLTVGMAGLCFIAWLASGLFIVRGNERAVVRRGGALVRDGSGAAVLKSSGLHYDWPWPFSRVDRVNLHEVRTLSVGVSTTDDAGDGAFLREFTPADRSQLLTGDKNILHVRTDVQYRVSPEQAAEYLFDSESADRRLQLMTESLLAEQVTQSRVDSLQTYGRAELQQRLIAALQKAVADARLGVEIESVTIDDVRPPIRVKAAFLDVNDARADREKFIQSALAYEEQKQQQARGDARKLKDEAETFRDSSVAQASAQADSFSRIVQQLRSEATSGGEEYSAVRQRLLRRRYLEEIEQILKTAASKVVLETGRQVDLTIFRETPR